MASITAFTAARMKEIEDTCIIGGAVILGDLILERHDGSTFNAGRVEGDDGAQGIQGPSGADGKDATLLTVELEANIDLNTVVAPGHYSQSQSAETSLPLNYPIATAGLLEVVANPTTNMIWQTYTPYNNGTRLYRRTRYNGTWSTWTKYTGDTDTQFVLRDKMARIQRVLTGGGIRQVDATGVAWSQRFIAIGSGVDSLSPNGYFDITMPPDGTVIPVYSSTTATTATVASGVVPISTWGTLYYDVPLGETYTSDPSRFKIVSYNKLTPQFEVPTSWVAICTRNTDSLSAGYTWGDGRSQDYWRSVGALANGWVAQGTPWPAPAYKFADDGSVRLMGLMKLGTAHTTVAAFTLPAGLGPEAFTTAGGVLFHQPAANGSARVEVRSDAKVFVYSFIGTGANSYLSLDGMSWFPAGS